MSEIVQKENKVLRKIAEPVADAVSAVTKTAIKKMAEALFKEPDGIGIAAPQIGISQKIFLVAQEVIDEQPLEKMSGAYETFINPVFKKVSIKKSKDTEGCLSVRGIYGEVARPEKVVVEYTDKNGKRQSRGASGLFARVLQHEMDHLDGVLFIDKAKYINKK
ncbi:peptide deformylase [Candidatus Kaiserbacteria bacterium RIFCSPHIGHO2_01_FULL_48_10]|uniref:Peptide deformylase n=1 Tax=Candidatus Kaiserbacteria bacterium RIFCSPHIGHO2_01_FULL_48_10 TaxID=1798476 RepID=A0A1F6C1G1_9BACT|nr:MAG: peptide deformylase [Candidatus Kaiserbacteria bacterium RIFCSPHIGHO2_01_FULL_48_10]